MNEIRSVGIPSPRVEGEQKVGGGAVYAVDVVLPDMLWAKVLRSPIAHGRIKKIDMARSLAAPGVRAAIIGAEMSGARIGKKIDASLWGPNPERSLESCQRWAKEAPSETKDDGKAHKKGQANPASL